MDIIQQNAEKRNWMFVIPIIALYILFTSKSVTYLQNYNTVYDMCNKIQKYEKNIDGTDKFTYTKEYDNCRSDKKSQLDILDKYNFIYMLIIGIIVLILGSVLY